jgi:hypothetical protein
MTDWVVSYPGQVTLDRKSTRIDRRIVAIADRAKRAVATAFDPRMVEASTIYEPKSCSHLISNAADAVIC